VIVPLVCGAGLGLAAWLLARVLWPAHPNLVAALETLEHPPTATGRGAEAFDGPAPLAGLGRRLVGVTDMLGIGVGPRLARDLDLVGLSYERYLIDKLLGATTGLVAPLLVFVALNAVGVALPLGLIVLVALGLMIGGFFVPDLTLRAQVTERRGEFAHAFALYLELVSLVLAGGGGIETSLVEAADAGQGWAFQALRAALASARLTGRTPWEAFSDLGERVGVPALRELAASVTLAGEQGAKVRASLTAKAASLREHEVRDAEADAEAATERMTIPLVMLLAGFVVFIGYPAMQRVLTSL
jgi:pilus assembly protein TadC